MFVCLGFQQCVVQSTDCVEGIPTFWVGEFPEVIMFVDKWRVGHGPDSLSYENFLNDRQRDQRDRNIFGYLILNTRLFCSADRIFMVF